MSYERYEMAVDEDSQALERLRHGDPSGFRQIFERHHTAVFSYLSRRSNLDRAELKDLLQEVFVQAHRHLARLEGPVNLRAWLLTVARNRLISLHRHAQTESGALQHLRWSVAHDQEHGAGDGDEAVLGLLEQALANEPDSATRDIVQAFYGVTRVTTQEISERYGIPKGTVTVKLQRFRQRLHRRLLAQLSLEVEP